MPLLFSVIVGLLYLLGIGITTFYSVKTIKNFRQSRLELANAQRETVISQRLRYEAARDILTFRIEAAALQNEIWYLKLQIQDLKEKRDHLKSQS